MISFLSFQVDDHELQDIASDPHLDHIIYVDEYDDLSSVKTDLYDKICSTGKYDLLIFEIAS